MIENIRLYLEELEQPHLQVGLESLSLEQCTQFLKQLKRHGHTTLKRQQEFLRKKQPVDVASLEPLTKMELSGSTLKQQRGERLIREGKVGCLVLAGGQGTRLGCSGPKGMVSVSPIAGKSLFQLLAERVVCASKRAGRALPLAIMTSPGNHAQTLSYFSEHGLFGLKASQLYFFIQDTLPLLDEQGNWLLQEPGVLAEGPDGNGNALKCFYEQGLWSQWHAQGIEYVNVVFVDNPLADPFDSEFVSFTAQNALDIGVKVVERLSVQEKMGIVLQEKGRLKVVEYFEFSPEASAKHLFASPGLFCFHMQFLHTLYEMRKVELPLHLACKTAQLLSKQRTVFKCETFQFDLLDFTHKSAAIFYPRLRSYAPLKNAEGEKSVATLREALLQFDREIYSELSGVPAPSFAFELDPVFYYPSEALRNTMQGRSLPSRDYITPDMF